jgi:hypothetical protein
MAIHYIPRPMPDVLTVVVRDEVRYRPCILVDMRQTHRARVTFAECWRATDFAAQAVASGARYGGLWRRL